MTLQPFLTFRGNCRQALTFYQGCLGGVLTIRDFSCSGALPSGIKSLVLHARLECEGFAIEASDLGYMTAGGNVALKITATPSDILRIAKELAADALTINDFSADGTIALIDKFGVEWLLCPTHP